ncbi:MAG TPA: FtsX-like permease family protein, partial [Atopostipes sp.]|nr:FtsX-like permease family protein [Atopostipes sp.]
MRYKSLWKDTFREIKHSITRFLAILVIIFLGVGFYVGISATSPNMIHTADQYYTNQQLMDFRILSTYGLTDENIEELEMIDDVAIQSHYAYDFLLNEVPQSIRLFSYNNQEMNQYTIIEGRLPENPGEIAIDSFENFLPDIEIGDTISMQTGDDGGNPEDHLRSEAFEVVGFVKSPLYIERQSRGTTTLGSGSLGGFGVVLEEDYNTDLKTEVYVKIDEARDLQAYSEEYEEVLQDYEAKFEPLISEMEARRADEIENEIQKEIDDGWAEIEETEQELADAEVELEEARIELDDGWQAYEDGLAELEEETTAAENEIAANEQELTQTINHLNTQRAELVSQRNNLETELANLNASEDDLNAGREQLEQGINQVNAGLAEIENNRGAIEAGLAQLNAQEEGLLANQSQLEQALQQPELPESDRQDLQGQLAEIEAGLSEIQTRRQEVRAPLEQEAKLLAQRDELQGQLSTLNAQAQELENGRAQIINGINQIDSGITQIDEGLAQTNAGYAEIENARETLASETANARAELADAEEELNEAEAEYEEGLATFEEERVTALEELEEGREELVEAEEDLAELPEPTYYLFDRSDNIGYMEYKDNADRLSIIAVVFPGFFFLIAIFISFTTMTRMVDEEREYIGIMKALGYRNRQILIKFITYAILATFAGATLGILTGYAVIPPLIFNAYASMYDLPDMVVQQYTVYTIFAFIAATLSTVGASLLAVRHSLKSNAATLLTPKAPKRGSRIWLERITPIWKRLSFNTKITFRNVFRYKSRMLMTILGIAGSTGLIVTAFGISDSVGDIADIQFGEINQFQAFVALDDGASSAEREDYLENLQNIEEIDDSLLIYQENLTARMEGVNTQDVMIYIPEDPERINDFIRLRDVDDDETIHELDNSGAIVTQKLSELFDLEVGDDFEFEREDDETITVTVSEIVENYMGHYLYMTSEYYQEVTGEEAEGANLQFIKFDTDEVEQEELGATLLNQEAVLGVTYATVVYDAFSDTLGSLDFVTQILVGAAAALAFIVLYNLTNINVAERQRELSTIKVLGSHDYE